MWQINQQNFGKEIAYYIKGIFFLHQTNVIYTGVISVINKTVTKQQQKKFQLFIKV